MKARTASLELLNAEQAATIDALKARLVAAETSAEAAAEAAAESQLRQQQSLGAASTATAAPARGVVAALESMERGTIAFCCIGFSPPAAHLLHQMNQSPAASN